ncbi:aminotransferase class V-fold PLP-dependent enzyme [Amphibiibacter pelophylacis]|uniref:Aminotransferase class V-fold PLP-dependent enzyme n=1 Tax=Amphibiibacter pelophylacis TaxID=1799477 RepID=A0ACC6P0D4_9BURK
MTALLPHIDPDGLLEFSVVYTDRALNHMSQRFQGVMRDLSRQVRQVYNAQALVIVPGSGTSGMEAVARQFANGEHVLVVRNGWFSYRWTQILETGGIARSHSVSKARRTAEGAQAPWAPAPLDDVCAAIAAEKPAVVFAPHVETSSGMMLPPDYIRGLADAVHAVGGLLVLDCIASGAEWIDMQDSGVDVLVSAPQKGWSSTPCAGMVLLGERALAKIDSTCSSSFALDLKQWLAIMRAYENDGHAYHATLPTDGLRQLRDTLDETLARGLTAVRDAQRDLGRQVRALLAQHGYPSVAAPGFEAAGVVVSYTSDPEIQTGRAFVRLGVQAAAGVPLQCDEGPDYRAFRLGLFGLDKWGDVPRSVGHVRTALEALASAPHSG